MRSTCSGIGRAAAAGKAVAGLGPESVAADVGLGRERRESLGVLGRFAVIHDNAGILGAQIGGLTCAATTTANQNVAG